MTQYQKDPEESTTDDDQEEKSGKSKLSPAKFKSVKLSSETWQDKKVGKQLKSWLRENFKFQNKSYSSEYLTKFIEVAQLCSRFSLIEDQDRAFDEVMSIFAEWPKLVLARTVKEYSNQNLLQILTEIGLPFWISRILFLSSRSEDLLEVSKEFRAERIMLLNYKDDLGNNFAHYLMKYINQNRNDGLYMFQLIVFDPLWFSSVKDEFAKSFVETNKMGLKPFQLLQDVSFLSLIQKEFNSGNLMLETGNEWNPQQSKFLDSELARRSQRLAQVQVV